MYLKKLNPNLDALWQRPKTRNFNKHEKIWFENSPVGCNPLNETMKNLSTKAKLSRIYTNHCIRASVVTSLDEQGFEARQIMATTGHKSENSIKSYASRCPDKKRRQVSDALASNLIESEPENKMLCISPPRNNTCSTVSNIQESNVIIPVTPKIVPECQPQLALEYLSDSN